MSNFQCPECGTREDWSVNGVGCPYCSECGCDLDGHFQPMPDFSPKSGENE
jgi:ribosomal protein L37AE/L43A